MPLGNKYFKVQILLVQSAAFCILKCQNGTLKETAMLNAIKVKPSATQKELAVEIVKS